MSDTKLNMKLKAPYPYIGGKAAVAGIVWDRLGNVDNYCEPFAGSIANLLKRPQEHFQGGYLYETVGDTNHFIVNFWRAVRSTPDAVAEHADNPVAEADLHSRHVWLARGEQSKSFKKRIVEDADFSDAKMAGWWVWGQSCWIGGGWCNDIGSGVHSNGNAGGNLGGGRPQLADAFDIGRGVNAGGNLSLQIPELADIGRGVNAGGVNAGGARSGTCDARRAWLTAWMRQLADRLRLVRTCYGHWSRICDSESTLTRLGLTGVFLDPPYALSVERMHEWVRHLRGDGPEPGKRTGKLSRADSLYASDRGSDVDALVAEVHLWCHRWGANPQIRIAVAGYEGEHNPLEALGWDKVAWRAGGGYANQSKKKKKNKNAARECLWFSPACLKKTTLFDIPPEVFP